MAYYNLEHLFNVSYTLKLNPIEKVWLQLKTLYRKHRLMGLKERRPIDPKKLVWQAKIDMKASGVKANCKKGLRPWRQPNLREAIDYANKS